MWTVLAVRAGAGGRLESYVVEFDLNLEDAITRLAEVARTGEGVMYQIAQQVVAVILDDEPTVDLDD